MTLPLVWTLELSGNFDSSGVLLTIVGDWKLSSIRRMKIPKSAIINASRLMGF